jgi:hypothetical protein
MPSIDHTSSYPGQRQPPIEQLCALTPTIRTDLRVERCIEIARECLAGDPLL